MDYQELCLHIGRRIKLYRKNQNMTAKQLANTIHKSTSAVSKYENGEVAIDIITLQEIADVLGVTVAQLIDIQKETDYVQDNPLTQSRGFFSYGSNFYAYFVNGKNREICKNILELHSNDMSVVLYNRLEDYSNRYNCKHLYYGEVSVSDTYIHMVMQNQTNNAEKLYIVVFNPFSKQDIAYGIISGISSRNMMPISYKVAISKHPLPENEELLDKLIFTKKELRDIRIYNNFSIDLNRE